VLGHYVRETKALTWEDAIRKMSALPANTMGMIDRGFLAVGMAADVTVFDPKTVIDRATCEEPAKLSEESRTSSSTAAWRCAMVWSQGSGPDARSRERSTCRAAR
jgi:N-acyl-D-aspartate/D-glutamate deacylase